LANIKLIPLKINNLLLHMRKKKVTTEEMLILLPRCLQNSECKENVVEDSNNCKQCGKCNVGDMVALGKQYRIAVVIATGGLMAREYIKKLRPKLIIAVACENELIEGVMKVFPVAVYAVTNKRPHGPCKNTKIEPRIVEDVIVQFRKSEQ